VERPIDAEPETTAPLATEPDDSDDSDDRQDPLLAGLIVLAIVLLVTLGVLIAAASNNMPADLR
jgi:hypothetical protein